VSVRAAAAVRRRRAWIVALLVVVLSAIAQAPAGAESPPSSAGAPVITPLSNLRTVTKWAYPAGEAAVRSRPSPRSSIIGRLQFLTGDGQAELYIALASARLRNGQTWIQIEYPDRPNGQTGWVPRAALESPHTVDGYLLVDRSTLRATLFRAGQVIFSAPIGVGKPSTITPPGNFYVMEKLITANAPEYGPYALGTSAFAPTLSEWPGGGVVGIHGTDEPQLIPGRPSHGCVRMRDADITRLWHIIEVGTPIDIT
jgi:hypothetical protein